jgi:regulator of cell morphogenesis and NO signaling
MNIQDTIGSIVAEDYRTAPVFSRFKIDFCCKGDRTVQEVCSLKDIDPAALIEALWEVKNEAQEAGESDVCNWSVTELAHYIPKVHHGYVRENMPVLTAYLKKIAGVHGDRHPELLRVFALFQESTVDLLHHMIKEETILFLTIKRMEQLVETGESLDKPFFFGSVENPIYMMRHEHTAEGDRYEHIAVLTDQFTPPADACNTYKVAFAKLREFEADLHRHTHLENNILFHKAVALEQQLSGNTEDLAPSCSVASH